MAKFDFDYTMTVDGLPLLEWLVDPQEGEPIPLNLTDKQLISHARQFKRRLRRLVGKRELDGMCAVMCYVLQRWLSTLGFETKLIKVDLPSSDHTWLNHVWLELPDGRILDPTADQFGLEPIYLGVLPKQYQAWTKED